MPECPCQSEKECLNLIGEGLGSMLWVGNNLHNYGTPEWRKYFEAALEDVKLAAQAYKELIVHA